MKCVREGEGGGAAEERREASWQRYQTFERPSGIFGQLQTATRTAVNTEKKWKTASEHPVTWKLNEMPQCKQHKFTREGDDVVT